MGGWREYKLGGREGGENINWGREGGENINWGGRVERI